MISLSRHVTLSGGTVTLRAWGAHVADGLLTDLFMITGTLGAMRDNWAEFQRVDVQRTIWTAFWRLVQASLDGSELPAEINWNDRLLLLEAMWELNDVEASEKRLAGLTARAHQALRRRQAPSSVTMNS